MGKNVFANGNAIACKKGDAKVIASFPDVCLSPPSPPAGPIPVPYPNSSFSKDMQNGSKTVKIGGGEVMLKDKSFYKSSPLGDEAATRSFGSNVISHVITGKTYFAAWSMDVKLEGENADRHFDLTTSNHASQGPGTPTPNPDAEDAAPAPQTKDEPSCECCGATPLHESQRGGTKVTEDQWYGLDEKVGDPPEMSMSDLEILTNSASASTKRAAEIAGNHAKALADHKTKKQRLNKRKRIMAQAKKKGCKIVPEHPCNVYRVFPPGKEAMKARTDAAEAEWGLVSDAYKDKMKVLAVKGGSRGKVHHRVPKSAGGCPIGDGNLVPDQDLSKDCQDLAKEQDEIHNEIADKWASGEWKI